MGSQMTPQQDIGTAFQRSLGLRWELVTGPQPGVAVEMDIHPGVQGPAGSLEGGVVGTLVDVAGASTAAMALGATLVATEHISVSFVAPGRVGPVRATGEVVRSGRRDAVSEVRVVDRGQEDRLMAVALVTVRRLEKTDPKGDEAGPS
ncbi:MAG: PaaI family thioesterase [Acidimicrobiales bacterium]